MEYSGKLVLVLEFEHWHNGSFLEHLLSFFFLLFIPIYLSIYISSINLTSLLCSWFYSKHFITTNLIFITL